jgi:hypothetical protein
VVLPRATPPAPVRKPAQVAVTLALVHKLPQAIDRGDLRDQADAVRRVGFNRASITQLFDQTLLAPDIEAQILAPASSDGVEPITRRVVRRVVRAPGWEGRSGRATARVNGSARIPTALPPYQPD